MLLMILSSIWCSTFSVFSIWDPNIFNFLPFLLLLCVCDLRSTSGKVSPLLHLLLLSILHWSTGLLVCYYKVWSAIFHHLCLPWSQNTTIPDLIVLCHWVGFVDLDVLCGTALAVLAHAVLDLCFYFVTPCLSQAPCYLEICTRHLGNCLNIICILGCLSCGVFSGLWHVVSGAWSCAAITSASVSTLSLVLW